MKIWKKSMAELLFPLLLLLLPSTALSDERSETERIAPQFNATTEASGWDQTRCDLLNAEYAIEVEWGHGGKWKEAVGQAVYYSIIHNRKPGIVLLRSKGRFSERDAFRCQTVCTKLSIRLWIVDSVE